MNILLINGSPKGKRSNTYKLASAFLEGIKTTSSKVSIIEEIEVNKLNITPCIGCFSCWNKTPGTCIHNDDMKDVLEKLLWADLTIWSFPLYYFNVPSKLKTLIDRQLPMVLPFMDTTAESGSHPTRYDTSNKKHVLISTCGFYTTQGNYDSIIPMFDHLLGKNNFETIFCSQGELFRVPELSQRTNEYLGYVKTAGAEYASGKISENTKKKLQTFLFPKEIFEAMADASWGINRETGEKADDSYIFTKQMAALYNPKSYSGKEIVLEMNYTDIGKKYQVVLKADKAEVITENFKDFTTKIDTPFSVWRDIAGGNISGSEALAKQMYKVNGDFSLMLQWNKYFGADNELKKVENETSQKNTNMLILLLPWTVFWIATSSNPLIGSYISIILCALVSVVFFKNKKTLYDIISNTGVTILSVAIIANGNMNLILPLSYLIFGLLWTLSCATKIPLSAHYSANQYGKDSAFENPIFIKTNLILTLAWGILYIITAILAFIILKTSYAEYAGILNMILPIGMGIFTGWFQKWYPAKVAKG